MNSVLIVAMWSIFALDILTAYHAQMGIKFQNNINKYGW